MKKTKSPTRVFSSNNVTPEALQSVLWETLQKARRKKIKPSEANVIINSAKEICNVARLELQHKILDGGYNPRLTGAVVDG